MHLVPLLGLLYRSVQGVARSGSVKVVGDVFASRESESSSVPNRGGDDCSCAKDCKERLDREPKLAIVCDLGIRPLSCRTLRRACWASPVSSSTSAILPGIEAALLYDKSEWRAEDCLFGVRFQSSIVAFNGGRLAGPRGAVAHGETRPE